MKKIELNYKEFVIRQKTVTNEVSLTDMWKATGVSRNKRPVNWLRLVETVELLLEYCGKEGKFLLENKPLPGQKEYGKRNELWISKGKELALKLEVISIKPREGTYAIADIAIAYAEYLSTEFHKWALSAIRERIEEEADPQLAYKRGRERAVKNWKRQGKSEDWIQDRINGIENYKQHTSVLKDHGVKLDGKRNGYAECADALNCQILGGRSKTVKANLGLSKKSDKLRDHLPRLTLTALSFAEAMADDNIEKNNLFGNTQCRDACSQAGERAAAAAYNRTRIIPFKNEN